MRSPIAALSWEIWRRNRRAVWLLVGLIIFAWLFNQFLREAFQQTSAGRERLLLVNCLLMIGSLFLVFGIFNYTEFNPQREWTGFPYRLFTLPVPTWLLVGFPICLGVVSVEVVYVVWVNVVFTPRELPMPGWLGVLIGAYLVFYLTILWSLAGWRIFRLIALGLVGTSSIALAFLPMFGTYIPSPWFSEARLIAAVIGLVVMAIICAFISIAHQRTDGRQRRTWLREQIDCAAERLSRRSAGGFASRHAAQFWFEWRQSGLILPVCIGAGLVCVIGPVSWHLRNDEQATFWILGWTLAMPVLLAMPVGKGFSKLDFWSADLSIPPFVATKPIASGELVMIKMKVAALSTVISWLLVLIFLMFWLPLWADLASLSFVRMAIWMAYAHSLVPQYAIAALLLLAGGLLTWKFLVGGLWIGLSGSRRWFIGSAAAYCLIGLLATIGLATLLNHEAAVRAWFRADPNRPLSFLEWAIAFALAAKFWIAVFSWHHIRPKQGRVYLLLWLSGTVCLILLAVLVWAGGILNLALMSFLDFLPLDVYRLRNLLLLLALLAIPFARLGLAPSSLARNRCGKNARTAAP